MEAVSQAEVVAASAEEVSEAAVSQEDFQAAVAALVEAALEAAVSQAVEDLPWEEASGLHQDLQEHQDLMRTTHAPTEEEAEWDAAVLSDLSLRSSSSLPYL